MHKYKPTLVVLMCITIMLALSCVSSAASLTEKSASLIPDEYSLVIRGTVPDVYKAKPITVAVYRPGFTPDMVYDGTVTLQEALANWKDVARDEQGSFEWKFALNDTKNSEGEQIDPEGLYTIYFSLEDIYESLPIYISDLDTIREALGEFNPEVQNPDEQMQVFEKNKSILNLDTSAYDRIQSSSAKSSVVGKLFVKQYNTTADLNEDFVEASVLALIGHASSNEDISYLINNYNSTYLNIDLEDEWYVKRVTTDTQKERIYTFLRNNGPYENFNQVSDQFQKGVIIEAVNAHQSPGDIKNILFAERNMALLGISKNIYNSIKYKDNVWGAMSLRRDYASCDAIVLAYNNAVRNADTLSGGGHGGYNPSPNPGVIMPPGNPGSNLGFRDENGPKTATVPFIDLDNVSWAKESIVSLTNAGIVNGKSATTFAPNDNVTREEFVKMLYLGANLEIDTSSYYDEFDDVKRGEWYHDIIASAKSKNLINGLSENSFGVGQNITRQDMAVIVVRLVTTLGIDMEYVNDGMEFMDDTIIQDYARPSVHAMQRAGIINGYQDETFRPNAFATRAEAAKIIFEFCKLIMR